jgi:hypothetical protein
MTMSELHWTGAAVLLSLALLGGESRQRRGARSAFSDHLPDGAVSASGSPAPLAKRHRRVPAPPAGGRGNTRTHLAS